LLTGGRGGLPLWDVASGRLKATLRVPTGQYAIAFSPDSQTVATASYGDGTLWLWNVATGQLKAALHPNQPNFALAFSPDSFGLAFSPDSQTLATASQDITTKQVAGVQLWNVASGQLKATLQLHPNQP